MFYSLTCTCNTFRFEPHREKICLGCKATEDGKRLEILDLRKFFFFFFFFFFDSV